MEKILIIDDDPDILETMVSLLDGENYSVTTCSNAKIALDLLSQEKFHFIISDISMPEMNGLDFLSVIRKSGIQTPLMFVTGSELDDHMKQALQLGAADYLAKPFEIETMLNKIHQFVEMGQREEKLNALDPKVKSTLSVYKKQPIMVHQK